MWLQQKNFGQDIGVTVDNYATAFPDMHRENIDPPYP
jgi:hypothetical protein